MSGTRAGLLLSLIDPVATTAEAASAGRPEALPYVPGAMLLGAVAARSYAAFDDQGIAFELFHSGALRFGDAMPVDEDGRLGFPVPASLHYPKGGDRDAREAVNLARAPRPECQMEQLRNETIALDGKEIRVGFVAALKTAVDASTGRAKDAQLFGIEALAPQQRFWAEISADNPSLLDAARETIPDGVTLRLGRSRFSEFGRIRADWIDAPPRPAAAKPWDKSLLLWALSDIALDPDADGLEAALGLHGAEIDASHSFVRTRKVWPWNGKWRARGIERLVVQRGSVIALENSALSPGIGFLGLHREIGCGRVMVAPALLDGEQLTPEKAARAPSSRATKREDAGGTAPVFAILSARRGARSDARRHVEDAAKALQELQGLYESAADLAGTAPGDTGPGPTQWSAVRAAVLGRRGEKALFGPKGTARPDDDDWCAATGRNQSFRSWLKAQWDASKDDPERLALIAKGAAHAASTLREVGKWETRL